MIHIKSFTFNPLAENSFVLHDQATGKAIVIDPGCHTKEEREMLDSYIKEQHLKVEKLLNTHCHIDHVLGNAWVKEKYGIELYIHRQDEATLRAVETYAPVYGFSQYQPSEAEHFLEEGDTVTFGESTLEVLFVPGYAPGHIAFFNREQEFCINGDCLFNGSIGRTDLPGGDFDTLIQSIQEKLYRLPEQTVVYCGHGPTTTIVHEKKHNPFVKG